MNEMEEIDSVMSQVPDLPKDFDEWIEKQAYSNAQYMIYSRESGLARCTYCQNYSETKKEYKHLQTVKCPHCGRKVICKSYNKQKQIDDSKRVGIVQKLQEGDGYILRIFQTRILYSKESGYSKKFWKEEDVRHRMSHNFIVAESFEWGEYKHTGKIRWCHKCNHGMFGGWRGLSTECILYTRNITKLLKEKGSAYMPLAAILREYPSNYVYAHNVLMRALITPEAEALYKAGLKKLAYEYLNNQIISKHEWKGGSPWKYLEISKEYFKLAVRMNAKSSQIDIMRIGTKENVMLTAEQIIFYAKHYGSRTQELLELGHMEKLYKYLTALESQRKSLLGDYLDYIEDLKVLRIPLVKNNIFPKNFEAEHRQVAEARRDRENRLASMELRKKNREFRKMLPEVRKLYECENDKLQIVFPTCKADFQAEGREQHNCVGGSYFDRMLRGECVVVFLREKTDLKRSYCTVEFTPDGTVKQNRAIYNRDAPKEAQVFIDSLSQKVKKELRKKLKEEQELAEKMEQTRNELMEVI